MTSEKSSEKPDSNSQANSDVTNPSSADRSIFTNVATIIVTYCLLVVANGLLNTIFSVRGKIEGFSDAQIGYFSTAFYFGMLLGAFYAKKLVIHFGYIRSFACFASLVSIFALIPIMIPNALLWTLTRFAAGFCHCGMVLVVEGWVNTRADNQNRGRIMGFYMLMNYGAMTCGQLLLMAADPSGFKLFTGASILLSLAVIPLLVTKQVAPSLTDVKPMPISQVWRVSPLGMLTVFSNGLINAVMFSLSPLLLHNLGYSINQTSIYMSALVLGGLAVQWPLGRLSDRIERRVLLIAVCTLGILMVLGTVFLLDYAPSIAFLAAFVMGGVLLTLNSIGTAHTHDYAKPGQAVPVAGGLLIAWGVGASVGPTLAVSLTQITGPKGIYYFLICVCVLLGSFALYRITRRASVPVEDRGDTNIYSNVGQPNFSRLRWVRHHLDKGTGAIGAVKDRDIDEK